MATNAEEQPQPIASPDAATQEPPAKRPKREKPPFLGPPVSLFETNRFGWTFDPSISIDDNYIDLAHLTARGSPSRKGHMGTVLIRPPTSDNPSGEILVNCTNVPVYPPVKGGKPESCVEIHAEANAVCRMARQGTSIEGCWIYITFPPCKDCFMLLVYSVIKRIVFRRKNLVEGITKVAKDWGVELVERTGEEQEKAADMRTRELVRKWTEENGGGVLGSGGVEEEQTNGAGDRQDGGK